MSQKSVIELLEGLLVQADIEVDEFNHLFNQLEEANLANNILTEKLEEQVKKYNVLEEEHNTLVVRTEALIKEHQIVCANGTKQVTATKQAIREREQMVDKLTLANNQLAAYKAIDTPKKIREKIKSYQTKVSEGQAALAKSKALIKDYRNEIVRHVDHVKELQLNEAQSNMTSIWSEDGDNLMLFPAKLTMQIGDVQERQLTLLYMTKSGCGKLIALDEEGLPAVCKSPAGGLKPKKRTLEVAGELLRKWRRQNWQVTLSDLNLKER